MWYLTAFLAGLVLGAVAMGLRISHAQQKSLRVLDDMISSIRRTLDAA